MQLNVKRIPQLLNIAIALGFLVFSVYLFAYGTLEDDQFRAYMAAVSAALSLMPTFIYHTTDWKKYVSYHAMNYVEMMVALLLVLNGLGALGFYQTIQYYDLALHIVNPLLGTLVIAILIGEYLQSVKKYRLIRVQLWTALSIFTFMCLWEVWEYWGDVIFGTAMFGQNGEWYFDTLSDIVGGICGSIAALLLNIKYLNPLLSWLNKRN